MSTVTVTMAFGRPAGAPGAHEWLRQAVESILAQTYTDWRLVIVNDADPVSPWPLIADIDDPRIVRFDMARNRGRYFIDAVIFEAFEPELWALQDPDDHCEPDRFKRMVPLALEHGAGFAPTWLYVGDQPPLFDTTGMQEPPKPNRIRHMVGYGSGVISGERLRAIGGFHPGFRVAYDTYMMNAIKLVGPWVALDEPPLQHKLKRPGGLTMTKETGMRSPHRRAARGHLDHLWRQSWSQHERRQPIDIVVRQDVPVPLRRDVSREAARMRAVALEQAA